MAGMDGGIHENLLSSPSLLHTRVCEGVRFGVFIIGAWCRQQTRKSQWAWWGKQISQGESLKAHDDGHIEPTHPPSAPNEGWMVSGQETVFCWVPVP
jgi:hypothetical protein